jgi:L-ascorbate metabolism protein UlaG (beta-lactamase superfamily)
VEIIYRGKNCVEISTKKTKVLVDPNPNSKASAPLVLTTDISEDIDRSELKQKDTFVVDSPGEYEINNIVINGVAAKRHIDDDKLDRSVMYRLTVDGVVVGVLGNIYGSLSELQIESIGIIDVLVIPVGGHGLTLDSVAAAKIIRDLEPKVVIPVHYDDGLTSYDIPQDTLEPLFKELGIDVVLPTEKAKVQTTSLSEKMVVMPLSVTKG